MFTVSEIGLTPALRPCLGTTNVIDNVHSGMRRRTGRVTRWRDGSMAVRWAAASFLDAEKGYRRIMGYKDLWMLKAHLDELGTPPVDGKEVAAQHESTESHRNLQLRLGQPHSTSIASRKALISRPRSCAFPAPRAADPRFALFSGEVLSAKARRCRDNAPVRRHPWSRTGATTSANRRGGCLHPCSLRLPVRSQSRRDGGGYVPNRRRKSVHTGWLATPPPPGRHVSPPPQPRSPRVLPIIGIHLTIALGLSKEVAQSPSSARVAVPPRPHYRTTREYWSPSYRVTTICHPA